MPVCKRDFGNNPPKSNDTFHDNEEVFFCEVTKEIFREYEDYFRHVMMINSTVWQCEATGRENLTYAEALKSERKYRRKMEQFKDSLRPVVMLVIEQAKQSSIGSLHSILSKFLRRRFFLNEEISIYNKASDAYKVIEIIPPKGSLPENGVYDDTEEIQYRVKRIKQPHTETVVPFKSVRRQQLELTSENLHMFIRNNVSRIEGILRPNPESYKIYVTDRKIIFSSIFIGKMPYFTPAKIKKPNEENNKKQASISNYLIKDDKNKKSNLEEQARIERERMEVIEAKAKLLKEEKERAKLEKRAKLMEKIEEECTELLVKTDDLERKDQRLLPKFTPITTIISNKILGDAFMLREFMHTFSGILSGAEVFRGNLNFMEMSRAFTAREVAGPLSDILLVLLGTVFDLQKEEEEDCAVEYIIQHQKTLNNQEPLVSMSEASRTHIYSKRHFSFKINELPLDSLTVSEVLRLHILSSGAFVKERAEKWRIAYRNGYSGSEDPGLILRLRYPHILRALNMYTIYNLPFADIMRVINCLMSQILTYSSTINLIEERMEQMAKARSELRMLSIKENKRQTKVQLDKRELIVKHNQQCLEQNDKNEKQKKELEEKLNKKIAELLAQSEREHRKHEQEVEQLNTALFNFLVYLGMDRAYRKYYVLESMPGIFVEHNPECMDICLSNPPVNNINPLISSNYPRNRKDLRAYLLKIYTDDEKKNFALQKGGLQTKLKAPVSQENKENRQNGLLNGLSNGYDKITESNGVEQLENDSSVEVNGGEAKPPTQYELYMCTGDPHNCIVHDSRNADRERWTYLYEEEDIQALIDALNPLGEREFQLREQLKVLRTLILNHVKKCPVDVLSVDSKQMLKTKNIMFLETHRKYGKANFGYSESFSLNEVMYGKLVESILQFESEIYTGDLGRLKVKDMVKWRSDVENNSYDPQGKLQWGPTEQKLGTGSSVGEAENDSRTDEESENEADLKEGGKFANKPYMDPGRRLGNTMEIDSEDSEEEEISLHDSDTLRSCVKNLASALLQVEQAIERRFIKEPFGAPIREMKDKILLERKIKAGADALKQWEVSLMESTSYSQVYLHLNILHDSILWVRSTNKSYCQVCRRGSDPEKMLLCDECNGGTHMFCMKPKMKTVPEGNWYCARCVKRLGLQNEDAKKKDKKKRKSTFIVDEEACSDVSSDFLNAKENLRTKDKQLNGDKRTKKRLPTSEIEEIIEEEEDDNEIDEKEDEDEEEVEDVQEYDLDDSISNGDVDESRNKTAAETSSEEDDNVCIVCSYDGGDLFCSQCKDVFHLECANLKRPPRYNFLCPKCKTKESRKRKIVNDEDSTDKDSEESDEEPLIKRSRQSRGSQQNSLPNGNNIQEKSSGRRSHRRTGDNLPLNSSALYELLEGIMKHDFAWPFLRPVSQSEVPDYYKIIKNPMDFAKVKSKLNMGKYQINEEVMNDIQLIFNNCDQYNVKGNEIYQAGFDLEKYVIERCRELNLPFKSSDMNE